MSAGDTFSAYCLRQDTKGFSLFFSGEHAIARLQVSRTVVVLVLLSEMEATKVEAGSNGMFT